MTRLLLPAFLLAAALSAQSPLVTTFAHNAAGLPNGAVYFDLDVHVPAITITRMDLNLSGSGVVEVWTKNGSRLGSLTNAAGWALAAVSVVGAAQPGVPTPVQLTPIGLSQGVHGIAIRGAGPLLMQTIGNGTNQTASNAQVTLSAGESALALFTAPIFAPRVVNAAIHYLVGDLVGLPGHGANHNGHSCGFHFTAATDFNIRQLALPPQGSQPGDTASYLVRVNGLLAHRSIGNVGAVDVGVHVRSGDSVDVIGNWTAPPGGANSAHASIANGWSWQTSILGVQHTLDAVGWSWDIGDPAWVHNGIGSGYYLPPGMVSPFGRVSMTVEPGAVVATNTVVGAGCGAVIGSCYELLPSAGFDLASSALTFTPQPAGGYHVARGGQWVPVGATGTVQTLSLANNSSTTVPFTVGSFPGRSSITVGSNGFVARAPGNLINASPDVTSMLTAPHTAFWSWHDFDPSLPAGGRVELEQSALVTVITWNGVWDSGGTSAASASFVQFQLYANGVVTLAWGAMSGLGGAHLVGYSPGGASPEPAATDLSALTGAPLVLAPTEAWPIELTGTTRPILGARWDLTTTNLTPGAGFGIDVLGLGDPGIADLAVIGMPGCGLRASLDDLRWWIANGPTHTRGLWLPVATSLLDATIHATTVVFTTPAPNAFGAITTNGVRGRIGDL